MSSYWTLPLLFLLLFFSFFLFFRKYYNVLNWTRINERRKKKNYTRTRGGKGLDWEHKSCVFFFPLSFGWEWVDGLRLTARPPLQTKAFVRLPWRARLMQINIYTDIRRKANNNHVDSNLTTYLDWASQTLSRLVFFSSVPLSFTVVFSFWIGVGNSREQCFNGRSIIELLEQLALELWKSL